MSVLRFLLSKSFFKTSFRIILTAVIFFIVLVVFLRFNTRHGDFILVPDLLGKNIEDLSNNAKSIHLLKKVIKCDHEKLENLAGLELELIYEWEIGSMLIFDRTNLHCSSSIIEGKKIGLTTFTKK